jgi:hypothetical protein
MYFLFEDGFLTAALDTGEGKTALSQRLDGSRNER